MNNVRAWNAQRSIAMLRVLRLAREAELAPKPEEAGGARAKPAVLILSYHASGTVL